jgi:hypothetical protein
MKYILLIILTGFINTCSVKEIKYFHGHICTVNKKPLSNLKIVNQYDSSINTFTNKEGYFRILKTENFKGRYLYVYKENSKIDSISIVGTHPERGPSYYFVNGRNDTLFIDMSRFK